MLMADKSTIGMLPADQGFEADNRTVDARLRLINQVKLTFFKGRR